MTRLLYYITLLLMDGYLRASALFSGKAKQFVEGRRHQWQKISDDLKLIQEPIVWFHCASVGEFEQGIPIMEAVKKTHPNKKILVTFFSPSGFEAIKVDKIVDFKYYLPLDYPKNARKLIDLMKPEQVFFVKYEFWFNYLEVLAKLNIPTYSVSSIFRPNQPFFKWYGTLHRKMLTFFDHFFVQDRPSVQLLSTIGLEAEVTGDTRFDRVIAIKEESFSTPVLEKFTGNAPVMVIGSMRDEDVKLITSFILSHDHIKFIVAPHEIVEKDIVSFQHDLNHAGRYSTFTEKDADQQVLIIDNIGMLSKLYRYGQYAYIGGGFSDGLHNILEPAVYEIPIFFGNQQFSKFKEAIDLIDIGAAFPVGRLAEMSRVFEDLDEDKNRYQTIKSALHHYVFTNQGAADKILSAIDRLQ